MGSNEQPGDASERAVTIRLTRDNIILGAAVLFLALAVLLAVFFPPESSDQSVVVGTSVADATGQPNGQITSVAVLPSATTTLPGVDGAPTGVLAPGDDIGEPYPAPDATFDVVGELPTDEPFDDETPEEPTDVGVPTFAPNRPTSAAGPGSGYPAPGSTATLPVATAQPARQTPTRAPIATDLPVFNTPVPQPTNPPRPTSAPFATPRPTSRPAGGSNSSGQPAATARPAAPPTPAPPTPVPFDQVLGSMRWTAAQSPIFVRRDLQIARGSSLVIEPGVEVRLAPGVAVYVEGTLYAVGEPGRPVRLVNAEGQRWDGLYGRPGSDIGMERVEIRGGGSGGTLLSSEGGNLSLRGALITDNGGHIRTIDSRLELRDSEISGNDMPYGAAVDSTYTSGGFAILSNNRIGGNRQPFGSSTIRIEHTSPLDTLNLDTTGNLLVNREGPNMVIYTNGIVRGTLRCNTLINGTEGLSVRSDTPQVPQVFLDARDNAIEDHTPPIIPIYLEYGIGRGATSELPLDLRNNWWDSPLGPYQPDFHADGRGEAVGVNIDFAPWLTERPACAPLP